MCFFPLAASSEQPVSRFLRIAIDDTGAPQSLDTSIVRYHGHSPDSNEQVVVDLISVVHVGDQEYYRTLAERFKEYDVLLYELILPEATQQKLQHETADRVFHKESTERSSSLSGLARLQLGLTNLLGLSFQLQEIDYKAANFVHADLTDTEFQRSMEERGESLLRMLFQVALSPKMLEHSQQNQANQVVLLMTLLQRNSPDRQRRLRRLLATEMIKMDVILDILNGPEGSTIINVRNDRALEVLKRELAAGKRKLGIFYGGAHMPDFDEKLVRDLGFTRGESEWFVAWPM